MSFDGSFTLKDRERRSSKEVRSSKERRSSFTLKDRERRSSSVCSLKPREKITVASLLNILD